MASMKLPPEPSENYNLWRKDIDLWKKLTDTPKEKMGVALQYACRHNMRIHEAVLNIPAASVDCEAGLDNVLKVLDNLHNVDQKESVVKSYEEFMSLKRRPNQKMAEFILEFEALAIKVKDSGNVLSADLLAHRLLQSACLSDTDQRIIKATAATYTVKDITSVLKKSFGESTYNTVDIKPEPIYHAGAIGVSRVEGHQHSNSPQDEDIYYASNNWRNNKTYKSGNVERISSISIHFLITSYKPC